MGYRVNPCSISVLASLKVASKVVLFICIFFFARKKEYLCRNCKIDNELHQRGLHGCCIISCIFKTVWRTLCSDPLSDTICMSFLSFCGLPLSSVGILSYTKVGFYDPSYCLYHGMLLEVIAKSHVIKHWPFLIFREFLVWSVAYESLTYFKLSFHMWSSPFIVLQADNHFSPAAHTEQDYDGTISVTLVSYLAISLRVCL